MRCFDIDLTVRVRCGAYTEKEAREIVVENFRNGKYCDTEESCLGVSVKEVE